LENELAYFGFLEGVAPSTPMIEYGGNSVPPSNKSANPVS
jgi:hypothetical protein